MTSFRHYWLLFIMFQLQWWGCALGAKYNQVLPSTIFVILTWIIEFIILKINWHQIKTITSWAILGIILDSAQSYFGIMHFKPDWYTLNWLTPTWLIALWCSFSIWAAMSTWLRNYKWIVTTLTLIVAPLSYWSGMQLGVLTLNYGLFSMLSIAGSWLILMVLILNWPLKLKDTIKAEPM
jgi:hypothetical protein